MFCPKCGKDVAEGEICPVCGTRVGATQGGDPMALVTLILTAISFFTGIVFGAMMCAQPMTAGVLLFFILGMSVLPAIVALSLAVYRFPAVRRGEDPGKRGLTVAEIVLTGVTLFFLFIVACVTAL